MREQHERRANRDSREEVATGEASEHEAEDRTRFSSDGSVPPVVEQIEDVVYKPSASQLAYKDDEVAFAPPKASDAKKEATSTSATVNERWPRTRSSQSP